MLALDLFAGTGWGVACQRLGIEELGVELMPAAIATRDAAGMATILEDVWTGLPHDVTTAEPWGYDLLIASPPCQTFSRAGHGTGRKALDEVTALIDSGAYLHPDQLRAFGERHDPRTALVVTPLAYVARDLPTYVVLEQVPPVLPVWEAMAVQLRANGYSVWTGVLNAEQYGVPQTRKRAILLARADGIEAGLPTPTHSRYYPRDPERFDNHGVLPWVSMAEAFGWAEGVVQTDNITGTGYDGTTRNRYRRDMALPAPTMSSRVDQWKVSMRSNYGTGGDLARRGERTTDQRAPTMTSKSDRNLWIDPRWNEQIHRPATVLQGDPRIPLRKHHDKQSPQMDGAIRVTLEQAAVLQSYPADFPFQGTKTQCFLQVGNAVPPLLAEAVLGSLGPSRVVDRYPRLP